ncbi:CD3324 family protein [Neobacillus mesonae]|nr:CD3324 family protein [Neobacillus mesonae]
MKYVKATTVLPEELVSEIQKYVQGEAIYIPRPKRSYKAWGSQSGGRKALDERNKCIREAHAEGKNVQQLAELFFLSIDSIKKIIYRKDKDST